MLSKQSNFGLGCSSPLMSSLCQYHFQSEFEFMDSSIKVVSEFQVDTHLRRSHIDIKHFSIVKLVSVVIATTVEK